MVTPPPPEQREPIAAAPAPAQTVERRVGLTPVTLFLVLLIAYVMIKVQLILILTLLALVFATIIEHPVQLLERRRLPRSLSILLVYLAIIGSIVLFAILIAPVISDQIDTFRSDAPSELNELRVDWRQSGNPLLNGPGQEFLGRAIDAINDPPALPEGAAFDVLVRIGTGIFGLLSLLVMTFYYLMEKQLLRRLVLLELAPGARQRVSRIWDDVEAKVGDWLRGQLILCLIIGVSATIGYGLLGVRFWPLLGLWAGITEIIPIVGPWLGGIPAFIIAMTMSWQKALLVAGFVVALQTTENWILVPRVMKGAVGLTPLTVFIAILAGTEFLGPIGAILAIPVAAAIQVVLTDYLDARRVAKRAADMPLPSWRWMRGHLHPGEPHPSPVDPAEVTRAAPAEPDAAPPPPTPDARGWTSLLARAATQTSTSVSVPASQTPYPPATAVSPEITPAHDAEEDEPLLPAKPTRQ
jgi:predicted PurR-regulated permease PerM